MSTILYEPSLEVNSTTQHEMILLFINLAAAALHHEFRNTMGNVDRVKTVLFLTNKCNSHSKFATQNSGICRLLKRRDFVKHFCANCQVENIFHHDKSVTTMRDMLFGG